MSTPQLPRSIVEQHHGWSRSVVWRNEIGGVTYRLVCGDQTRFCKCDNPDMIRAEVARLQWAGAYLPVPEVITHGAGWMLTRGLSGVNAIAAPRLAKPAETIRLLGRGLRRFHAAPVKNCPFDYRLGAALAHVRRRVATGVIVPERDFHPEFRHLDVAAALQELERAQPDSEELVVTHGDYCFPNVLLEGDRATGFVDLGELGVADRWRDLAVATWSVTWNTGPGHEDMFLDAYEIAPDPQRLYFYRLLYMLTS